METRAHRSSNLQRPGRLRWLKFHQISEEHLAIATIAADTLPTKSLVKDNWLVRSLETMCELQVCGGYDPIKTPDAYQVGQFTIWITKSDGRSVL